MACDNLLYSILLRLKKQKDFVFLWNGKTDRENYRTFIFINSCGIISTYRHDDIKRCFLRVEDALSHGFYLAGYLSYEAASGFEDALPKKHRPNLPLLWLGVYKEPLIYEHKKNIWTHHAGIEFIKNNQTECSKTGRPYIKNIKATKTKKSYLSDIDKIKDYIRKGETYQVNYTFKYKFSFSGCPYRMFFDLNRKQSTPYAAFISFDNKKILSLSPELFFRKKANTLKVKPMKGTIGRGKNILDDLEKQKQLENSLKDKAENVMIVDMLRNDLGRISKTGAVRTIRLFETERYQTLYQMTSTIKAKLKNKTSWYDIFKSVFPSGSVTGAPKIRTMQIIERIEKYPRNIYTGSIGYISPKKEAAFNVAIRTVVLDESKKQGELGIGSGITISSDSRCELEECKLKSNFFIQKHTDFQLIEALLWRNGKFFLLDMHLGRLKDSADYFDYKYSREHILQSLTRCSNRFDKYKSYKVRLLLNKYGEVKVTSELLKNQTDDFKKITFSKKVVNSSNIFLYHKTTNRKFYDDEYLKYKKKGFVDVIFLNEKKEVTEGAISNIIVKNGKYHYTSPISSGLLNGVYRQHLLDTQILSLKEKVLDKQDITTAEKLYICNSVRGLIEVNI